MKQQVFAVGIALLTSAVFAAEPSKMVSVSFAHHDWELACDNTRTCRAAGYQSEESEGRPVSMLLTRKPGPNAPITAEVMLGNYEDPTPEEKKAAGKPLVLRINGKQVDDALVARKEVFVLSPNQVQVVLASLSRSSKIELSRGGLVWQLSDKGSSAVLLKMDEFQGRLNTPGALIRRGTRNESLVPQPDPVPVVYAAPLAKSQPQDTKFVERNFKALLQSIGAKKIEEICPPWNEKENGSFAVIRLSENKLLLSASPCLQGAYNFGDAYWVINDKPPFQPELVTDAGSDFTDGTISATHKGRGLGDCMSNQNWTWDGKRFVKTAESTTGLCRMVTAGGPWDLPTLVVDVKKGSR